MFDWCILDLGCWIVGCPTLDIGWLDGSRWHIGYLIFGGFIVGCCISGLGCWMTGCLDVAPWVLDVGSLGVAYWILDVQIRGWLDVAYWTFDLGWFDGSKLHL